MKLVTVLTAVLANAFHGATGKLRAPQSLINSMHLHRSMQELNACPCGDLEYERALGSIGYDNTPSTKSTPMEKILRSVERKEAVKFKFAGNKHHFVLEEASIDSFAQSCSCPLFVISGTSSTENVQTSFYFKCCKSDKYCGVYTSAPKCVSDPTQSTTTTTVSPTTSSTRTATTSPHSTTSSWTTTTSPQPTTSTIAATTSTDSPSSTSTVGSISLFSGVCSEGPPTEEDCLENSPCSSPTSDGNVASECPDDQLCFPNGICAAVAPTHYCGEVDSNGAVIACDSSKDCSSAFDDPEACDGDMQCVRECGVFL